MKKLILFIIPLLMSFTLAMGQADANGFITIGTGSQNKTLPIYPFMSYSYSQVVYLQSEIDEAGEITKLYYYYGGEGNNQNSKDWVIYMGHTSKSEFAAVDDWVAIGDLTQVYDGEVILTNTKGWIEIPLSTPFTYNNTDNLVVAVDENTPGQGNGDQTFNSTIVTENRGLRQVGYGVDNIDPAAPGSGILVDGIANIKLLIPKDYAFTVNAPTSESAIIGTSTQYSVSIDNIGLLSDTFTPTITGDGVWTYALYEADGTTELTGGITIAPGTFADFIVQLTVPAGATMGDTDTQNFAITAAGGSQTTQTFSITTTAKEVLTVPFSYGFEDCVNNQPVALWGQAFVLGSNIWRANSSYTSNNRAPRTGDFNACLYSNTQRWLLTPSYFELSASKTYKFSVYARQDGIDADRVSITLMYGASATAEGMTEAAKVQTNIVGDEYQRIEGIFSPSADGNYYLGVLGEISYDGFSNYLSIDDISVEEIEFSVTSPLGVTVDAGMSHDYHVTITNVGQNSDNFTPSIVDGTWTYGLYELDGTTALTGAKTIASGASYEFIARVDVPTTANFNDTDNAHLTVTSASGTQAPTTISITTTAFAALPLPFFEGFENCNNNAPVALWGQAPVSGFGSWKANSSSGSNRAPRTGDLNAYLKYDNSRWLFSPSNFELEASKIYRFSVYARQDGEIAANASITLMYGTTATAAGMTGVVKDLTGVINGDYQLIEGTFSPTADGNFYVGILGEIDWAGGTSYYLSIDDISLVETFDNDAALTNISSPVDVVEFNAAHDFIVRLKNNGENNLTDIAINWAIGNPVVESGVFNWTGMLSRGESEEVTLTNYTFATPGDIAISASIDWAADMVANNNTIEKSIYVEAQKCGYTIDLVDSYGDGWNDAIIGFKQNGVIVGTFGDAFTTGSTFGPISVDLEEDVETQIVVVNYGGSNHEIGFTVTDPFGYMVFHRATGDWFESDQIFHTFTSSCIAPTPHSVTLTIVDNESAPIEGAIVTFDGVEHVTGADGIVALVDVVNGTYDYTVTKTGYVDATGEIVVNGADVSETITLDHVTYSVIFTIVDVSDTPIEGATISINSQKLTTNTVGVATIELANGVYPYTVSASGYVFYEGSITVSGAAVNQSVPLAQATAQMVLQFDTNLSDGTTVTLPLQGTVNATVNWGDGSSDTYTEAGNQDHTYAAEGTYTVEISGSLTQFGQYNYPNADKLVKVTSFGDIGLYSLDHAFHNAVNLVEVPTQLPSSVKILKSTFREAINFNFDIGGWDVSNVGNMRGLFHSTSSFNQDISNWDVSNVRHMSYMFCNATAFNQNIGNWNVSNVTSMFTMFNGATSFNQNIGSWNVGKVTSMNYMFSWATAFNQDISGWDVSKVLEMPSMFSNATAFNQDLGSWNVTSVTNMTDMFAEVTLSTANYNSLLIGWAAQTVQNGVVFSGGNSKYSPGAAADARAVLTGATNGWTITDGGELSVLAVSTLAVSDIAATSAIAGGNVTADGGSPVTARGVIWGTSANPTIETHTGITADGDGLGTFTSNITGLTENTTYHVRAYATNANGTEYGVNKEFTTDKVTSIGSLTQDNLKLYPNPFQNTINISNANNATRMVITNVVGKVVMVVDLNQVSNEVIETNVPSGMYLVTIFANDGSRVVRKMVRE